MYNNIDDCVILMLNFTCFLMMTKKQRDNLILKLNQIEF